MVTHSEENYLKAIFHLSKQDNQAVSTNAIATKMETKASSATDMIKKLSEKDFIDYQKYRGVKLTNNGRLAAAAVIRKHRLWEVFLVDKLHFSDFICSSCSATSCTSSHEKCNLSTKNTSHKRCFLMTVAAANLPLLVSFTPLYF